MRKCATLAALLLLFGNVALIAQTPSPVMPQQPGMPNPVAGCSGMSQEEQAFAAGLLNMNNQVLFCSQFSPGQRQQAMEMAAHPDANGNKMSADDAVERTMQNASPAAGTTSKRKPGGACPLN